jgi:hypothetical protein
LKPVRVNYNRRFLHLFVPAYAQTRQNLRQCEKCGLASHVQCTTQAKLELTRIGAFGSERAMFESNFPIDKGSCGYAVLWNAFKRIAAGCSAAEEHALSPTLLLNCTPFGSDTGASRRTRDKPSGTDQTDDSQPTLSGAPHKRA